MKTRILIAILVCIFLSSTIAFGKLKAGDFKKLVGYTVVEITNVQGEFEGADFGKSIALDNGMVF